MSPILPSRHQRALPLEKLILGEAPGAEAIEMDVLFVGAGPAGLAGAIELARLAKADQEAGGGLGELNIGVLEKASGLGEHNLSGAVVNPRAFRELFPELTDADFPFRQRVDAEAVYFLTEGAARRIPTPPTMHNTGNYSASISEMVRWLGAKAEELGVNVFTGFPVDALLVKDKAVLRGTNHAERPQSRRHPRGRLCGADRPDGAGHRAVGGDTGHVVAGVVRMAGSHLAQSADLRARREGSVEGGAPPRSGHPYDGVAAPQRRVRWELVLSAGA